MSYIATIPVVFSLPRSQVYAALCDLALYPLWNSGMKSARPAQTMAVGLTFTTETLVAGRVNTANVVVTKLIENETIELRSTSGLVSYDAVFILKEVDAKTCEVICSLRFELRNFMLDMARPVIEAMAQARIRGDLETLRAMLTHGA